MSDGFDSWVGQILDNKYEMIRLLGRGGMGAVFEAEHRVLHRRVAIKLLDTSADTTVPGAVKRFIREGQAVSAIHHPNIIDVQDLGVHDDDTYYIVMELLKGCTLQTVLQTAGPLKPNQVVAIALQVLSALNAAHRQGIIHRDLKPENIFLATNASGRQIVKVMDFGVAKYTASDSADLRLTKTGTVLGTPFYLSPEQASGGKHIDERIDIWSLGVILYESLTGQVPYGGDNFNEVLSNVLMQEARPILEKRPDISPQLAAVVEKAMAKDKVERFENAEQMMSALFALTSETGYTRAVGEKARLDSSENLPPIPSANRIWASRIGAKRGNMAETIGDEVLALTDSRPVSRRTPTWRGWGLGAAVIFLTTAAAVLWGSPEKEVPVRFASDATIRPSVPSPAETPSVSGMKAGADLPAGPVERADSRAIQSEPRASETVTLRIEGLPDNAVIHMDGEPVSAPIVTNRLETPARLHITARGYRPLDRMVVPSRDRTLTLRLQKVVPKARRRRVKQQQDKPTAKSKGATWRANPFE